jgi:PEP-CTERM motif-containing protein
LGLGWFDPDNPLGFVDLSNGFEPLDVLNIPLRQVFGSFSQQTETCRDDLCFLTSDISTSFTFTSFTVSAATVPVPEPGTLSLFLLGVLATAGARSRRGIKSSGRS